MFSTACTLLLIYIYRLNMHTVLSLSFVLISGHYLFYFNNFNNQHDLAVYEIPPFYSEVLDCGILYIYNTVVVQLFPFIGLKILFIFEPRAKTPLVTTLGLNTIVINKSNMMLTYNLHYH
jgi:hypothetical protein